MTTASCYTVHDTEGLDALPAGTKLRDIDGDCFEKMGDGYRQYGDASPYYTATYLEMPAVVLNSEVLGSFPLQPGDRAVIADGLANFLGLKVEVLRSGSGTAWDQPWVQPLSQRPDGHGLSPFYWPASQLTAIPAEPLKVGDRVIRVSDTHCINNLNTFDYGDRECKKGSVGTVTKYTTSLGDGVGVDWDHSASGYSVISASQLAPYVDPEPVFKVGDRVLVTYDLAGHHCWDGPGTVTDVRGKTIIVQPDHMDEGRSGGFYADTLSPYVDPEPEPVRENFELAGAYVKGQEALDVLPAMSIVDPLGSYLPMLKLRSGEWVSVGNVSKHSATVSASWVRDSVVERGGVVLYANPENA